MAHVGGTSIGVDELALAARHQRLGLIVAVVGGVLTFAALVLGIVGGPPIVAAVGVTLAFVLALAGVATFVHQRAVIAVGSTSAWRLEQVEVGQRGVTAESRRVRVQLAGSRW